MNDATPNEPMADIDFTLDNVKKRRMLYLKRPTKTPIPFGMKWICACGKVNVLTDPCDPNDKFATNYCGKCGSRLRNQENDNAQNGYATTVVVTHFSLLPPPARR